MNNYSLDYYLSNENIKADRFGMAAIAYIFKAFGDSLRFEEYWPWSDRINSTFVWNDEAGETNEADLTRAVLCLKQAQLRLNNENTIKVKEKNKNSIKALKKRLDQLSIKNKTSNVISTNINETSKETKENFAKIIGENIL